MCILLIYIISLSILYVSQKELSFIELNQQIRDFYLSATFENQKRCGSLKSTFFISGNYSFIVIQCAAMTT